MPKATIDISDVDNKKLKILAVKNGRTLKQFIPRFIHECLEKNVIDLDERTGEFITHTQSSSQNNNSQEITLNQLKELGVHDIKLAEATTKPTNTKTEEDTLPPLPEQYGHLADTFTPDELLEERKKIKVRQDAIAHFMKIVYTHTHLNKNHDINYIFDCDSSFIVLWPETELFKKCPHPIDYGIEERGVDTKKIRYAYSLPDDLLISEYCPDLDHYIDQNGDIKVNNN